MNGSARSTTTNAAACAVPIWAAGASFLRPSGPRSAAPATTAGVIVRISRIAPTARGRIIPITRTILTARIILTIRTGRTIRIARTTRTTPIIRIIRIVPTVAIRLDGPTTRAGANRSSVRIVRGSIAPATQTGRREARPEPRPAPRNDAPRAEPRPAPRNDPPRAEPQAAPRNEPRSAPPRAEPRRDSAPKDKPQPELRRRRG